jgi:hypothetical protein
MYSPSECRPSGLQSYGHLSTYLAFCCWSTVAQAHEQLCSNLALPLAHERSESCTQSGLLALGRALLEMGVFGPDDGLLAFTIERTALRTGHYRNECLST